MLPMWMLGLLCLCACPTQPVAGEAHFLSLSCNHSLTLSYLFFAARKLLLRPLSAAQVRHILQRHQLEHHVPEGRSVSNGFAALTGYTLGLTKALTGVFIYDIITANISDSSDADSGTAQHVCFSTRSLDDVPERRLRRGRSRDYLDYNPYEDDDIYVPLHRQTDEDAEEEEEVEAAEAAIEEEVEEAIEEEEEAADADTGTNANANANANASTDTGTDSDTDTDTTPYTDTSTTTTATSDDNSQTCLILYGNR